MSPCLQSLFQVKGYMFVKQSIHFGRYAVITSRCFTRFSFLESVNQNRGIETILVIGGSDV